MGNRTRDEVIYSRVDYRVKQEFESQKRAQEKQQVITTISRHGRGR